MTTRKPTAATSKKVTEHLDRALDAVLAARVEMGLLAEALPIPDEALDTALGADTSYQATRVEARDALNALLDAARVHGLEQLVFVYEAAANHQVAVAMEVGWRVGVQVTSGAQK